MSAAVLERPTERPECDICIAPADYEYAGNVHAYRWVCVHHYRRLLDLDPDEKNWLKID